MLLASFDLFGRVADFEPATGELSPERAIEPGQETHGHYGALAGTVVVFYRDSDGLHLRVGVGECRIESSAQVRHRIQEPECVLDIDQVAELRYPVPSEWYGLENDLTPFVEAEDFDFGLFIANVVGDQRRVEGIYRRQ
ncbi:hypothetical protein [Kitasatospora sp. NPDC094016]|uniref:hypothetical protein n=1 Tax=Kitasatospora sp. NPDC094016 TaxID=3154986 RepID=UPI003317567D